MKRISVILFFALLAASHGPAAAELPPWMERWLFNPEERTRRGIEAAGAENPEAALEPLDSAARLSNNDPLSLYNSGTGRLAVDSREALLQLQVAANEATPELAARAHYNLGNGQLSAGNLPEAIESFKTSLRHDPTSEDTKFNLELAQKLLAEQPKNEDPDQQQPDPENQDQQDQDQQDQQQQDQQQQDQQQQDQQDQQQQDQQQQDQQEQEQQEQQEQQQDQEQQDQDQQDQGQQDQQQQEQQQDQQNQQQERPLPQFQDLPDMTAEEAAAILEAIENLEREQRREQALEAAQQNAGRKKDW